MKRLITALALAACALLVTLPAAHAAPRGCGLACGLPPRHWTASGPIPKPIEWYAVRVVRCNGEFTVAKFHTARRAARADFRAASARRVRRVLLVRREHFGTASTGRTVIAVSQGRRCG